MACRICGKSMVISKAIGVCVSCIRKGDGKALIYEAHLRVRKVFGLPLEPPKDHKGIPCNVCSNKCVIGEGQSGYCGLKLNNFGRLYSLTSSDKAIYYAYLDPHVTNCCAAWFCPAGTGIGYPKYACKNGPEYGYYNLAIFFYGCNFNCLFCQNSSHKNIHSEPQRSINDLINYTINNNRITCWCFFGGSPEPQLPFAINASKKLLEMIDQNRVMRICFEWNGCGNHYLVKRAAEISYITGGNIKFDLKCWDENLSYALCGVSNRDAYKNFEMIANEFKMNDNHPPVLCATTLLVPSYVDEIEIESISKFISELNPKIPYSLLIFHPDFMMNDLPITPLEQVVKCYKVAKKYLQNVHIGNLHLLGFRNMDDFLLSI